MKRSLYLWHRYLGIGLSLAFALWFATGVVMLYAQFPILTPAERLAGLQALDPARFSVTPAAAVDAAGLTAPPRRMRMSKLLDRPIYYILPTEAPWLGVYADDGQVLTAIDATTAGASPAAMRPPAHNPHCSAWSRPSTSGR